MTCSADLLPGAAFERDPTIDYAFHKAALHTMATCHSLRTVNAEMIGDPLDVKMFEYTGWSFQESVRKSSTAGYGKLDDVPASIVRPTFGSEHGIDDSVRSSGNDSLVTDYV